MYGIKQTHLFWHMALVLRTGFVRMFRTIEEDATLPARYKDFSLQETIVHTPRGIGLYVNERNERVLIKVWKGSMQTYEYFQLVKEIRLYELLHEVLRRVRPSLDDRYRHIKIPRLIEHEVTAYSVIAVFEYIEGCIHLKDVSSFEEKVRIFNLAFDFWKYIGDQFTDEEKRLIPRRSLFDTFFAFWVSLVYAVFRYPLELPALIRSAWIVLRASPAIVSTWSEGLVHRDFHFENILVHGKEIVIIDFGDNAFTSLYQIFSHALHWEWDNLESRSVIGASVASVYGTSAQTARVFRAFCVMTAVQLLHDTEDSKRLDLNFRCFYAAIYHPDNIPNLLFGASTATNVTRCGEGVCMRIVRSMRAIVMRLIRPKSGYPLLPISNKFGFDRGTPVDRYLIERFISKNQAHIRGVCLEIGSNEYTIRYGSSRVMRSDVLDINTYNTRATVYGDIRNLSNIPDRAYDCVILTHTLGLIDDHAAAVREVVRIVKPGGVVLVTVPSMGVMQNSEMCFWRYTPASLKYLFSRYVPEAHIMTASDGNVLLGQAFWTGCAVEELESEALTFNDPRYPVITTGVIVK